MLACAAGIFYVLEYAGTCQRACLKTVYCVLACTACRRVLGASACCHVLPAGVCCLNKVPAEAGGVYWHALAETVLAYAACVSVLAYAA
jgi:hypothetical protein